jgi:hypothetical protein
MAWRDAAPRAFLTAEAPTPQQGDYLARRAPPGSAARRVLDEYVDNGDSLWINNYLRGVRLSELSAASKAQLRASTRVLGRLIEDAPRSRTRLVLFRAVAQDAPRLQRYARGDEADFLNKGIVSASASYDVALGFVEPGEACCLLVLLVPAGARLLEVLDESGWPEEREVLLPHGSTFKVERTAVVRGVVTYYCLLVAQPE